MAEHEQLGAVSMRGELRRNEPLNRHTSWRAGGPADRFYIPADLADLAAFLRSLPEQEPVYMVGLGSNLLVRDAGLRGTVVLLHGALKDMRLEQHGTESAVIYAEAGVASPKVARFAALHDFEGAEFLAGIPGTVGGALAMNAGCYGSETWEVVEKVAVIDRIGMVRERKPVDYDIHYRHVALRNAGGEIPPAPPLKKGGSAAARGGFHPPSLIPHPSEEWFVAAWFRLRKGDGSVAREKIKQLLTRRISTQPLNLPNAGSVFRNPPGNFAARLIEGCGLRGFRIGGAMVSPKHANFIVNTGGATAADIEAIIETVQETVKRETGVELEREVRIIGEPN